MFTHTNAHLRHTIQQVYMHTHKYIINTYKTYARKKQPFVSDANTCTQSHTHNRFREKGYNTAKEVCDRRKTLYSQLLESYFKVMCAGLVFVLLYSSKP